MVRTSRPFAVAVVIVALLGPGAAAHAGARPGDAAVTPLHGRVRVDQLGYLPDETKRARLMSPQPIEGATYVVEDSSGDTVLTGNVPAASSGSWNSRFHAVYRLGFSGLTTPGRYRIRTLGPVLATSPYFSILDPDALYGTLLTDGIRFDQVQRDGRGVIRGALDRRPSHLLDAHARVYAWPRMARGSDLILDRHLKRIGGPVDVAGGWFDAGDYLKFTHSTAYNDVLLYASARMLGDRAPRSLTAEARHGLSWLEKMWRPRSRTLLLQVGIGSGNRAGTFLGDHDLWRLPQADDQDHRRIDRFVSHRPVFEAARPGRLISPNLVGRVSAAFALAAQIDAGHHPRRARHELRLARLLYARADTRTPPHPLVTALPHAFYPESSWRDDMELGGAEIALAAHDLGLPGHRYLRASSRWARGYIAHGSTDTFNLYDTSALAHTDLVRAMEVVHHKRRLAVSRAAVLGNLRAQLLRGVRHARTDPFAAAGDYDQFDVNSHTFGLVATAAFYRTLTGSHRFDTFATTQRDWLLGANPWGVSAMVGVGTRFPFCMQHQVANLKGSGDGTAPLDVGAVVNGPNAAGIFSDGLGGFQDGMVHCSSGKPLLTHFDGHGSRFVDDVRSWQTDEPALDMTGAAIIAAASQLSLHRATVEPASSVDSAGSRSYLPH